MVPPVTTETGSANDGASGAQHESDDTDRRATPRGSYPLVASLLVLAVALGGVAVLAKLRYSETTAATSNTALVDVATTAQVKEAMSTAAERLFSIDYNDIDATQKAADELLVSDEVKQKYTTLMGRFRELAPKQKLVVTVTATRSAVMSLEGDRARVMVYIDQTATRAVDKQESAGAAAMWFTAERHDGQWKVAAMDTYTSPQSMSAPSPEKEGQGGN